MDKGADVLQKDSKGWTVLHLSCFEGDLETVKELLESERIDLETKKKMCGAVTNKGKSALKLAKMKNNREVHEYVKKFMEEHKKSGFRIWRF